MLHRLAAHVMRHIIYYNSSLLRWFLGQKGVAEGELVELDDIRQTLRLRNFYYYVVATFLNITVAGIWVLSFPSKSGVAWIWSGYNIALTYIVLVALLIISSCKTMWPEGAPLLFAMRFYSIMLLMMDFLGRRGAFLGLSSFVLFSQYFGSTEINLSKFHGNDMDLATFNRLALSILAVHAYTMLLGTTIRGQVTREIDEMIRSRSDFVTRMSHELRTPLTGIIGAVELLRKEATIGDEAQNMINIISSCANTMTRLVSDILDMNRLVTKSKGLKLCFEQFDLGALIQEAIIIMTPVARTKGLNISALFGDIHLPLYVFTDRARLQQVITNLLSNAVKFTSSGEILLSVSISSCVTPLAQRRTAANPAAGPTGQLQIIVSDSGIGMDEYTLKRIFMPFEQGSIKGAYGGSGLGLAISRFILSQLGGKIEAESAGRNKGSCFTITLPIQYSHQMSSSTIQPALTPPKEHSPSSHIGVHGETARSRHQVPDTVAEPKRPNPRGKILLAEDNAVNQLIMRNMLRHLGYLVDIAPDGKQAVALIDSGSQYDAIILDWEMPELDGIETAKAIQLDRKAATPIIIMSAHESNNLKELISRTTLSVQFHEILSKPVTIASLDAVLRRIHHD